MQYRDTSSTSTEWQNYWYEKNLKGDVVAVYSSFGTKLVSYTYDAWGNHTATDHSAGSNPFASYNPFRYRGYYYDTDLGLYYLQSRYYDSNTGRFISPDSLDYLGADGDLTSYNLYDYCANNPVMYTDPDGHFIHPILAGAIIGFVIGVITSVVEQSLTSEGDDSGIDWVEVLFDGVVGAANGALAASGIGKSMSILAGAVMGGGSSVLEDVIFNDGKVDWVKAGVGTFVGVISGIISGPGANCKADGSQVTRFINSRDILERTIKNGTKHVISRQTNAMNKHISNLVVSAGRYLGANAVSFMFNIR